MPGERTVVRLSPLSLFVAVSSLEEEEEEDGSVIVVMNCGCEER